MVIGKRQAFGIIMGAHNGEHGAEDFFLIDAHILGDVVEQAAAHVIAVLIALQLEVTAIDF